jgi:hypothetical protein
MKKIRGLVLAVACAAVALGAFAVFSEAQAGPPCRCPLIVAPVICDNGKTYTNLCFANCDHAKNCVRTGD